MRTPGYGLGYCTIQIHIRTSQKIAEKKYLGKMGKINCKAIGVGSSVLAGEIQD